MNFSANLRRRPHPRVSRAVGGGGAWHRLRACADRDRRRRRPRARISRRSIRTAGCRSSTTAASCCSSRLRSRSISPRSIPPASSIPARSKARPRPGNGASGRSPRSIAASISGRCMPCGCRRRSATPLCATRRSKSSPRRFKVLDAAVAEQPYLLGGDFTVADLNVAAVISRAVDMDLSPWPHLQAWLTRCLDRPAARAALALKTKADARTPRGGDAAHRADQPAMSLSRTVRHRPIAQRGACRCSGKAGLREAEKIYTRVLKAAPDNFDALNLLGTVKVQLGHIGEAHRLFSAAVKINPARAGRLEPISARRCMRSSARRKRSNASTRRARSRPTMSTFSISTPMCC